MTIQHEKFSFQTVCNLFLTRRVRIAALEDVGDLLVEPHVLHVHHGVVEDSHVGLARLDVERLDRREEVETVARRLEKKKKLLVL